MSEKNHSSDNLIAEQLGIRNDMRVWIGGHQIQAKRMIEPYLSFATKPPAGEIDIAFITPETLEEAVYFAEKIQSRLTPTATIWIILSNKSHPDLTAESLITTLQPTGYTPKKNVLMIEQFLAAGYTQSSDESLKQ